MSNCLFAVDLYTDQHIHVYTHSYTIWNVCINFKEQISKGFPSWEMEGLKEKLSCPTTKLGLFPFPDSKQGSWLQ